MRCSRQLLAVKQDQKCAAGYGDNKEFHYVIKTKMKKFVEELRCLEESLYQEQYRNIFSIKNFGGPNGLKAETTAIDK